MHQCGKNFYRILNAVSVQSKRIEFSDAFGHFNRKIYRKSKSYKGKRSYLYIGWYIEWTNN